MQKRNSENNLLVTKGFSLKISNIFRFALIFISIGILLQIISFSVSAHETKLKIFTTTKSTEKLLNDKCVNSEIPFHSGQSSQGADADVEPTEDEIHHDLTTSTNNSIQNFILDEFIYTSFIKSRYLGLASSLLRQEVVPYFVLYHSWKNYLV